ncbi:MAG: hypothetical protein ACYC0O_00325 [Desulfurivibrionaceae bacterium]|jgi:predicted ABC-type ATPase|nr:hypothetical protein [Planctomycetota bacterium]MCG2819735.1 hypothetical protein [Actinomycetes bacterium]MCG2822378.1 hypothetical protein [Desulfobulbaceae bacterium]PKN22278.1 MAG: hypothetical protein CVU68_04745 [Deltaproteobacteria bacterium HGW-Deltaproteobacteria-3]
MSEQNYNGLKSTCWIIAGLNGAGKTTFALKYLPKAKGCTHFINADRVAAHRRIKAMLLGVLP